MESTPGSDLKDFARIGLDSIFIRIDPDFRDDLVRQTLMGRERVSPKARERLNKAINDIVSVDGFRNASLAPPALLFDQVLGRVSSRSDLAGAVLRVWTECQEPLRDGNSQPTWKLAESSLRTLISLTTGSPWTSATKQ